MKSATTVRVNVRVESRHRKHLNIGDELEFVSTQDCALYFTNGDVFGITELELTANEPVVLTVAAEGTTQYTALEPATAGSPTALRSLTSPNDIVVP